MTIPDKKQLKLFVVFYKSTLLFSITCGVTLGALNFHDFFVAFGFAFLSAGTVISLMYKGVSKKHEYYFYHNKGISKTALIMGCSMANLIIGLFFILIATYAKHP